jgi:hypothetical protein
MKSLSRLIGFCAVILFLLFILTNPRDLPSSLLMAPFILLFIILLLSIVLILRPYNLARAKRLRLASTIAGFPVLLLVLQSLGQLTVRDALAMSALFGMVYFYISRLGVRAPR